MSGTGRQSREDHKKARELEELRKAGTIAPEVDEDGNMVNPHIPQYMSQAPWYLDQKVGLKHQKGWMEKITKTGSESRSVMGQGRRKKGVSKTRDEFGELVKPTVKRRGKQVEEPTIAPRDNGYDDSYDGKHDRWNGYDPSQYKQVIDRHEALDNARRKKKATELDQKMSQKMAKKAAKTAKKEERRLKKEQKLQEKAAEGTLGSDKSDSDNDSDSDSDSDGSDGGDDMKLRNEDNQMGSKFDNHEGGSKGIRTTVRNLRIREDTAKYLYNLDPSSAYYDPKSRSMRADPRPHIDAKDKLYAGDNMVRSSGEVGSFSQSKVYAWQASERGQNLTIEANPTATQLMHQKYQDKKESVNEVHQNRLTNKYGNASEAAPSVELILGQTENYVEYSRDGRLVKGEEKMAPKSKFPEDVHPGNHTSVWGSYFCRKSRMWGFACCHNLSRNAYCVPVDKNAPQIMMPPEPEPEEMEEPEELAILPPKTKKEEEAEAAERMEKAKADYEKAQKEWKNDQSGSVKRGYNLMKSTEVTEEDMEVYRMKKIRSDDPMAKFLKD